MKKTLCLLLAMVLITALFAGCAPAVPETSGTTAPTTVPTQPTDPAPTDPEPTDPIPTDPEPAPAEPQEIAFTYQSVGAPYDSWDIKQYTIRSREELEVYISEKIQAGNVQSYWDAVADYDQDFFADHTLLVIYIYSHSVSVEWTINGVMLQPDGSYVVSLHSHCPLFYDLITANYNFLIAVDALIDENAQIAVDATHTEDTWDDMEQDPAEPNDQPKEFEVQILCAGGPRDEEVCAIALRSTAELHAYCQQYAQDLEKYFHEEIAVYDDAFFADHTLIVLAIHEGTCSTRHEVTQVIAQADGNYVVYIDRTIPADQSDAEAFWHILIAVEGCCAEDAQVTVEENNIFLPLQW